MDNEVCIADFPTDDDIIEHYSTNSADSNFSDMESDEEGSVDEIIPPPSNDDVRDCFRCLNLYLQTNDTTTDDHYKALNKLESFFNENSKRKVGFQSLISDYFNLL